VIVTLDGAANDGAVGEGDNAGPGNDVETLEGGFANDLLVGNGGANRLDGMGGADAILGLAGADLIIGGGGADMLTGGAGPDTFEADDDLVDAVFGGAGFDEAAIDRPVDGDPVRDVTISVELLT
jgi:Ca2+-binding RTX toxin-like protein